MFTGIIEEVGTVSNLVRGHDSAAVAIKAKEIMQDASLGDSIAVNGVCLTIADFMQGSGVVGFKADATPETLMRSTLGTLHAGSPVNLERACRVGDRLGGHIVSGHIDGVGTIISIDKEDNSHVLRIGADSGILRYVVEKGSIAVDGISLTVAAVARDSFTVSVIPHTFSHTDLSSHRIGDKVNLECDIIGKYVEKLIMNSDTTGVSAGFNLNGVAETSITREFLSENGFC